MARVVLARRARRELLDLGWPLIDAVEDALGLLEREPLAGHALRGRLTGLRSLRCNYFRYGVSKRTFCYLDHFTWWRIVSWLRKRHLGLNWGTLSRRYLPGWEISDGRTEMFRPQAETVRRYRYRGTKIPTPWAETA